MPERKKEKAYMVDSDLSLQDVTCRHGGSTQISGVRLPWGTPKLWLHRDWGWCGAADRGLTHRQALGGQRPHREFPKTYT